MCLPAPQPYWAGLPGCAGPVGPLSSRNFERMRRWPWGDPRSPSGAPTGEAPGYPRPFVDGGCVPSSPASTKPERPSD